VLQCPIAGNANDYYSVTVTAITTTTAANVTTITRDSRKSRQKMVKNTAHFCKNRKNHGKITAVYIAANLLKLVVSNSQNTYHDDVMVTYSASNKAHRLW